MSSKKMYCYTYEILNDKVKCDKGRLEGLIELLFSEKNNNVKLFEGGNKALIFDGDDNYLSLDWLKKIKGNPIDEQYIFLRIGRQKELEGALKRDKITYLGEPILDENDQQKYELEICTYLLIDLNAGVLLEMYGQYAPSVKGFTSILNSFFSKNETLNKISIRFNKILTEKMVDSFKSKGTKLSRIGYTYNIPDVSVLKHLGLDIKQIQALQELNVVEVDVRIKNRLRIPLTKNIDKITFAVDAFKECVSEIKETLSFRGATNNSASRDYSFTSEEVTYTIDVSNYRLEENLKVKFSLEEFEEQVFNKMKERYEGNKSDISEYMLN